MSHQCLGITLYNDPCENVIRRGKYCIHHRRRRVVYVDDEDSVVVRRKRYRRKNNDIYNQFGYILYVLMFWPMEIIRLAITRN